jgi:hypothetical protein
VTGALRRAQISAVPVAGDGGKTIDPANVRALAYELEFAKTTRIRRTANMRFKTPFRIANTSDFGSRGVIQP